jgi:transposase
VRRSTWPHKKLSEAGKCALLYQDEARVPLVPTLTTTLGVKGHRPVVGTWDNKDVVQVFGAVDVLSGRLVSDLYESATTERRKDGLSKTARMQAAFARHLEHIGQTYPAAEVVLVIDNAPWHRGKAINAALENHPQLKLYRLPSYSPQLNAIEKLWKKLRRGVSHNRLFESMRELTRALSRWLRSLRRNPAAVLKAVGHAPPKSSAA